MGKGQTRGRPPKPAGGVLHVELPSDLKRSLIDGADEAGTSLVRFVTVLLRSVQGDRGTHTALVDSYLKRNAHEIEIDRSEAA